MKYLKSINNYDINEANLYYSKEFIEINDALVSRNDIIGDISKNIALSLNTDVDFDINFIDPGNVEGLLKFGSYKSTINKNPDIDFENPNSEEVRNFLKDFSKISGNGNLRMGRFINILFPNKYTSIEIDKYIKAFYSVMNGEDDYTKIIEGEDIRKYYNSDSIFTNEGSLGKSCMRYYTCYNFFDIYVENPNKVKLLVLMDKETDMVKARALLWWVDDNSLFDVLMDRVYSIDDISTEKMVREAISNNWGYKTTNSHSQQKMISFNGKELYISQKVTLGKNKNGDYSYRLYPYMDTFSRYNLKTGILYNDARTDLNDCIILMSQDGGYGGGDYNIWSEYEGEKIPSDDSVWSEAVNSYLSKSNSVHIEYSEDVDRVGFYPIGYDGICHSNIEQKNYFEDECVFSKIQDSYIYKPNSMIVITDIGRKMGILKTDFDLASKEYNKFNIILNTEVDNYNWYISYCKDKWVSKLGEKFGISKSLLVKDLNDKYLLEELAVVVYGDSIMLSREDLYMLDMERNTDEINYIFIDDYIEKLSNKVNIPKYLIKIENKLKEIDKDSIQYKRLSKWLNVLNKYK